MMLPVSKSKMTQSRPLTAESSIYSSGSAKGMNEIHPILETLANGIHRGYAIQHAMPISSQDTISLSSIDFSEDNVYVQGLINLAELFVTFDSSSIPHASRYGKLPISESQLVGVEETLLEIAVPLERFDIVQRVDFIVTKQWMRILLWQQAMSRGLLSSVSFHQSMTFFFPAQVVRDLLAWMMLFSTYNLLPLGRDQVSVSLQHNLLD
jgi:hypothetical protein